METASPIRVLLVDDQAMVRQGLRSALEAYPNITVVGEAADGDEAVLGAAKHQPTVVVIDINMPKMDGITATRLIKTQHPEMVVLGITAEPEEYQIYAMQKAGASEVLKKDEAVNDLYAAIQRAVASVQPILILEETTTPLNQAPREAEPSDNPSKAESVVMKKAEDLK
jgi:DNA-binding NarL/FixJ family response regulator